MALQPKLLSGIPFAPVYGLLSWPWYIIPQPDCQIGWLPVHSQHSCHIGQPIGQLVFIICNIAKLHFLVKALSQGHNSSHYNLQFCLSRPGSPIRKANVQPSVRFCLFVAVCSAIAAVHVCAYALHVLCACCIWQTCVWGKSTKGDRKIDRVRLNGCKWDLHGWY